MIVIDMENKKILVVEDDEFLREIYLEILKDASYSVDSAIDGQEAYDKIKVGGYDLVLLDILLPKMDGLQVMEKLQAESAAKANKAVVFLTNLDNDEQIKEALRLGDGYLIKSQLTPENLLKEITVYLTR